MYSGLKIVLCKKSSDDDRRNMCSQRDRKVIDLMTLVNRSTRHLMVARTLRNQNIEVYLDGLQVVSVSGLKSIILRNIASQVLTHKFRSCQLSAYNPIIQLVMYIKN